MIQPPVYSGLCTAVCTGITWLSFSGRDRIPPGGRPAGQGSTREWRPCRPQGGSCVWCLRQVGAIVSGACVQQHWHQGVCTRVHSCGCVLDGASVGRMRARGKQQSMNRHSASESELLPWQVEPPGLVCGTLNLPLCLPHMLLQVVMTYQASYDPALVGTILSSLAKASLHERAGELQEYLGKPQDALAAYRRGHAYRWALRHDGATYRQHARAHWARLPAFGKQSTAAWMGGDCGRRGMRGC